MNWWTLGFQTVNFLVLVWLLQHFLYLPVREIMARRKGEIDRAYAKAAAGEAAAESARREFETMRADAAKAAAKMIDEAKEASTRERNTILAQARADAENVATAARERIAREREEAGRQLRERIARLGVEVAAALVRQSVSNNGATPLLADRALRMLEEMPPEERQRMAADLGASSTLELASAAPLSDAQVESCTRRIAAAFGHEVPIEFIQDADLIAGVELRLPHAVVNCSWKQSLAQALKTLLDSDGDTARHG
jgi:F-type H+-transporting ATPase subunit b